VHRAERIRLIEESSAALAALKPARFQLVLRTFGVETFDYESGFNALDELTYCIDRVESLDDAELRELHTYAVDTVGVPETSALISKPWGDKPVGVFLSHRHEDAQFVSGVRDHLRKYWGIDAFVAHTSLDGGKKWRDGIRDALAKCHYLVAVLHEYFHASQWCDQEVGWAMGRNLPILPVRLKPHFGDRMDGFLEEYQDVVLDMNRAEPESFLAWKIFEGVLKEPRTHHLGIDALAEAFVSSRNFAQTDLLWPLLEKFEADLEPRHLRRLEQAVANNDQIYRCHTAGASVPKLVKGLIDRVEPPQSTTPDSWAGNERPF
jgi:hypothetical protein